MTAIVPIVMSPRPSARVRTIAAMLDADETTIRRLVDAGELEAHTIGKRGVRIYLDSVTDYQERQAREVHRPRPPGPDEARPRRPASSAAHRAAIANLRAAGIIR